MNSIYILLIALFFLIGLFFINLIIFEINPIYVFFFEHKDFVMWREMLKNVDKFHFEYEYDGVYKFSDNQFYACVWKDGFCSIHKDNHECMLSPFYKEASKRMAKLLMQKIENNESNSNNNKTIQETH